VLEGEDLARLEAHLDTGCAQCRRELARRRGEVAALAEAVTAEAPPAGAREALLERIERDERRTGGGRASAFPEAAPAADGPSRAAWWWGVAAGLLVVLLGWSLATQNGLRGAVERLEARNRSLEAELGRRAAELDQVQTRLAATRSALRATAAEPEAVLVALDAAGEARARLYRHPGRQDLLLVVDRLPPAPEGRVYELWGIVGGRPLAAGVFDTGTAGEGHLVTAFPAGTEVDVWAVTVEPAGGVPAPTGAMVLKS
jgi:hypothetical protein